MKGETILETDTMRGSSPAATEEQRSGYTGPDRRSNAAYSGPDRRKFTWKTIVYGMIKPRRKIVRREADAPNAYVDFHSPHVLVAAATILVLSVLDGLLAVHLSSLGARELNPAMSVLVERDAVLFAIAKWLMTATAVVALVIAERARIFGRIRAVFFLYGIMVGYVLLVSYSLMVALSQT